MRIMLNVHCVALTSHLLRPLLRPLLSAVRSWFCLPISLLVLSALVSCKVVNTHVIKLTNVPEIGQASEVLIKTTKGYVYLSTEKLSEGAREMLLGMRPYQCLAIRTSEPFDMNNREVHFTEFKLTKLVESNSDCRKIKAGSGISIK